MYNLAIRKCTSPPLLALRLKIYYPARDQTPDLLNQRQTCYHLSQHGKLAVRLKMGTKVSEAYTAKKAGNNEVVSIKPLLFVKFLMKDLLGEMR